MATETKFTPGPWRWELNPGGKRLSLLGGVPQYDLTVMDFERWGMNGATMRLRDTAHDGWNIMYRVHERDDWHGPQKGREHHADWHQLVMHPDAALIEASPNLYAALERLHREIFHLLGNGDIWDKGDLAFQVAHASLKLPMSDASAALAKARGEADSARI